MPENEFTEFQRRVLAAVDRVLAAVEKPKRGRLLAIINSSFFIWLMSVLLLTIGGSYITNHKQCLDDAEKIMDRRDHLRQEMYVRDFDYEHRVAEAKTFREAVSASPRGPAKQPLFSALGNLSYGEMHGEYYTLSERIRYEEFPDPAIDKLRREKNDRSYELGRKLFGYTPEQNDSSAAEADLLTSLQLNAKLFLGLQTFEI